ncbi:MAG TPA: amidohydrolase family protein [Thermoanaerobaculia bacterium]|nr:amidohydrolase family protein [Thermoanaerobaculia bacterium]
MRTALLTLFVAAAPLAAQQATMSIEEYDPRSTLVVPEHPRSRAKFPFIDVHSHQRRDTTAENARQLVEAMDRINMAVMVNLSGGSGEPLVQSIAALGGRHPKRFVTFANVDLRGIDEPGFGERAARQLEEDVKNGAAGLKIYKNLGMTLTDASGKRVPTDDPRLDPIWRKAGELGIPVLIHTGEPAAFWQPVDKHNERWLELTQFPARRRTDPQYVSFDQTMREQHNLFRRHPRTRFITAHLGWYGHDLAFLGKLLDELPNVYTELGAVLYELGRQPRTARAFLIRYQDRVLMGKDIWNADEFATYFRVLETEDEYFDYYRKRHAFWKMYGLGLADEVLKKIYYRNALKLIPAIDKGQFPE